MSDEKFEFEVGQPIPSVWLHMEFDFKDTITYLGGKLIESQEEANRLNTKYILPTEGMI